MYDVDALIAGLRAPAPPRAPPLPAHRWGRPARRWGARLALAAALALIAAIPPPERVGLRGAPAALERVDLRMVVERDGVAMRITDGAVGHVGERVFFRGYGDPGQPLRLSVSGPSGALLIQTFPARPGGVDLQSEGGLLAYEFSAPGRYTFTLAEDASSPVRKTVSIEVR